MEEIILVSDNHGKKEPLDYLRKTYPITDYFIHCGDSEMHPYELDGFACVQGNNDFFHAFPTEKILTIAQHRILVVHGHMHMIFGHPQQLARYAKSKECDIAMYGHSHIPSDTTYYGVRCLNPGSIWHNRDGSKASYMIVHLDEKDIYVERKIYDF